MIMRVAVRFVVHEGQTTGNARGATGPLHIFGSASIDMPVKIAKKICEAPAEYPSYLVNIAEATYNRHVASQVTPVGKTAETNRWLEQR